MTAVAPESASMGGRGVRSGIGIDGLGNAIGPEQPSVAAAIARAAVRRAVDDWTMTGSS
jgi:hypothetical protein